MGTGCETFPLSLGNSGNLYDQPREHSVALSSAEASLCRGSLCGAERFSGVSYHSKQEWMVINDYLVETVKLSTSRQAHSAEAPLCRPHAWKVHVVQYHCSSSFTPMIVNLRELLLFHQLNFDDERETREAREHNGKRRKSAGPFANQQRSRTL